MAGKRGTKSRQNNAKSPKESEYQGGQNDVEAARNHGSTGNKKFRFRDNSVLEPDDQRRVEFKRKLLAAVDESELENFRMSAKDVKKIRDKNVRKFYYTQNDRLDDWLEVDAIVRALSDDILESFDPRDDNGDGVAEGGGGLQETHGALEPFLPEDERKRRQESAKSARLWININVGANILLLTAKIVAAFYSSSLSLIASLVDSALDLLCTAIVFTTSKLVQMRINSLKKKFPVGRRRLEPLGILVFSILMIVSFMQILQESVEKVMDGIKDPSDPVQLPPIAIAAMASTIGLKGLIWFGCIRIKTTQVQALAQDCQTDVVFNTLSLIFPAIGHAANIWWLDPVGAGLLSLFIIYDWGSTCFENVSRLTGAAVDDRIMEKLTFLAWRFSPLVDGYKSITAYHAGDGVWVEIDILLDEKATLEVVHDIAETLQYCCEGMPEVDRAFVTIDYAVQGPTGHAGDGA